jgi:hypothetical protein
LIQFVLCPSSDPDKLELRTSGVDSNTSLKPPLIISRDQLAPTLLCLMRSAAITSEKP